MKTIFTTVLALWSLFCQANVIIDQSCEINLPIPQAMYGQNNYYQRVLNSLENRGFIVHSNDTATNLQFHWETRRMGRTKRLVSLAVTKASGARRVVVARESTRGRARSFASALRNLPYCQVK